jgi:hypothetical protein
MTTREELDFLSYILAQHREGDRFLKTAEEHPGPTKRRVGLEEHLGGVYAEIDDAYD